MANKPNYEELEQKVQELEKQVLERSRAAEMLEESVKNVKTLLNAPTYLAILVDPLLRILALNKMAARRLGGSAEQLISKELTDLLPHDLGEHRKARALKVISTGEPVRFEDYNDGRLYEHHIQPILDEGGKVTRLAIFSRDITERKNAEEERKEVEAKLKVREKELKIKSRNLEEANIAMKVLLQKGNDDRIDLEQKILLNIKWLILPYLQKLKKSGLDERQEVYRGIVETFLNEIISPFTRRLSSPHLNLTPTEIQVANFVKEGKTTKEVAELLNSSTRAVCFHRENLRRKLGLKNEKTNLRSYLLTQI